jgi:hypothetical protein
MSTSGSLVQLQTVLKEGKNRDVLTEVNNFSRKISGVVSGGHKQLARR